MSAGPRVEPCVEEHTAQEQSRSAFWHWFALAVLLVGWIAEATMCADRGF